MYSPHIEKPIWKGKGIAAIFIPVLFFVLLATMLISCAAPDSEASAISTSSSPSSEAPTVSASSTPSAAVPEELKDPEESVYMNAYLGFGIDLEKIAFKKMPLRHEAHIGDETEVIVNAELEAGSVFDDLYAEHYSEGQNDAALHEYLSIEILERGMSYLSAEERRDIDFMSYCIQPEDEDYYLTKQTINLCGKDWAALDYCYPDLYTRKMYYSDEYYTTRITITRILELGADPEAVSASFDEILSEFFPVPVASPRSTPMPPAPSIAKVCGHYYNDAATDALLSEGEIGSVGYLYTNEYSAVYYLIVKNNTSEPVAIDVSGIAKTKGGDEIKAWLGGGYVQRLDPGAVTYTYLSFDVSDVESVEYTITTEEPFEWWDLPDAYDLSMTIYANPDSDDGAILLTNTGNYTDHYPEVAGTVLYFDKDDHLLATNFIIFGDCAGYVKPGETYAGSLDLRYAKSFDHIAVYLNSKRDTRWRESYTLLDEDQYELHTYTEADSRNQIFMTVKNKTEEDIILNVCCVVRDRNGDVLEVVEKGIKGINSLAPNQETILNFYLYSGSDYSELEWIVSGISTLEYYGICYSSPPSYLQVDPHPWLEISSVTEGQEVTATVTNKYSSEFKCIMITALFLNEYGDLVGYATEDICDIPDGAVLSSGATVTQVFTCSNKFSRVMLFAFNRLSGW